uniref:Ig-like domain-containing protein n=1 Tax=Pundamilia nyererei TaxID=303518 RepID=A0A3B4HB17_9CICH
ISVLLISSATHALITFHFLHPAPPDLHVFAKNSRVQTNIVLTCLATGFYPKDVTVTIRRNKRVLTADDGLKSSGLLPNDDDTFQRREYVEVLKSDPATYSCEVWTAGGLSPKSRCSLQFSMVLLKHANIVWVDAPTATYLSALMELFQMCQLPHPGGVAGLTTVILRAAITVTLFSTHSTLLFFTSPVKEEENAARLTS